MRHQKWDQNQSLWEERERPPDGADPGEMRHGLSLAKLAKSLQSCSTLCSPEDCSFLGFFAHGILQARILEWVAISSSRGSSRLRDRTLISCMGRQILHH